MALTSRTPRRSCQVPQTEIGSGQPFPVHMELEGWKDQCSEQVRFAGAALEAQAPGTWSPASSN